MKSLWMMLLAFVFGISQAWAQTGKTPPANLVPADASAHQSVAGSVPQFQQRYPRYQIESGDNFTVNFQFTPEFNQTLTVQPDGFVTLRGLGDIHVQGKTVPELTQTLETAYSKILNDPVITVVLQDFDKPYFVAGGQVAKPGKYDLRGETSVVQALEIAGGLLPSSKHSQVVLYRRAQNGMWEAKLLNVKKMLAAKDLSEDMYLRPGDMLFVPQNTISKLSRFLPNPGMGMGIYANPKP